MTEMSAAPPAPRPQAGQIGTGIVLMIVFVTIAPIIDVFAKLATQSLPPGEITLARFLLFVAIATICFITAISVIPIVDAIAIFFVEPILECVRGTPPNAVVLPAFVSTNDSGHQGVCDGASIAAVIGGSSPSALYRPAGARFVPKPAPLRAFSS